MSAAAIVQQLVISGQWRQPYWFFNNFITSLFPFPLVRVTSIIKNGTPFGHVALLHSICHVLVIISQDGVHQSQDTTIIEN